MTKLDRRQMRMMLIAHDPHCWFCGKRLTLNNSSVDHFQPLAADGADSPENFRLACKSCNSVKGHHPIEQLACSLRRGEGIFHVSQLEDLPMSKIVGFNYEGIADAKARNLARDNAVAINSLLKRTAACVVEIGKRLRAIREVLSESEFSAWLRAEVNLARATCNNYMKVSAKFGDLDCLENFQPSALIYLSKRTVPEDLVDDLISQATNGKAVTTGDAVAAIRSRRIPKDTRGRKRHTVVVRLSDPKIRTRSFGILADVLVELAPEMTRDEREALADRFLELALQLRRNVPLENGELKPVA